MSQRRISHASFAPTREALYHLFLGFVVWTVAAGAALVALRAALWHTLFPALRTLGLGPVTPLTVLGLQFALAAAAGLAATLVPTAWRRRERHT